MQMEYFREHYGDIASVVGLVVAMVGFVWTLREVGRSRRAADEARQAVRDAVRRFESQLLLSEIGAILQHIREVTSACRKLDLEQAIHNCEEVQPRLGRLSANRRLMEEKTIIDSAVNQIVVLVSHLEKVRKKELPTQKDITEKHINPLRDIVTNLSQIQGRLQAPLVE
jgi:hypothetical protein